MNRIISSEQIEKSSIIVRCGTDQGTGFYIAKGLLLTARHVIDDCLEEDTNILINGKEYDSNAILAEEATLDLCIIQLSEEFDEFLPLVSASSGYYQPCSVFGFPYSQDKSGAHIGGRVNKIEVNKNWNFSFNCDDVNEDFDFGGLSGGPILSNGNVIGVALRQKEKSILAISIRKAYDFLTNAGISVNKDESLNEIPIQLKHQVEAATPNYSVYEDLSNKLEKNSGWFLCHGSPGCGKTTFVAAFNPLKEKIKVCGRYFTKIPQDNESSAIRISDKRLISWIENSIGETLGISIDVLDKTDDRLKRIPSLLEQLSNRFSESNCTFFIDGLDEVANLKSFLSVFPSNLPSNLSVVLSCTSKDILPPEIKNLVLEQTTVTVTPLDIGQCEAYINDELKEKSINIEAVQTIAIKSEGHPLYLQYLINFLRTCDISSGELEQWITEIPSIGGEISKYYEVLWEKFFREESKLWIVITLSQLRNPISQEDLINFLPGEFSSSFYSNFSPISYLLKDPERLELYHSSFREFIAGKVPHFIPMANNNISEFCIANPNHRYSIDNTLHHVTLSSKPQQSITLCNQDWADICANEHVNPVLVIQDLKSVISVAVNNYELNEVIRLLLLLQRIEFRYDSVFAENAAYLASALIAQGAYSAAMKYLLRDNTLLVSDGDAIHFLQLLYEDEAFEEGNALLKAFNARFRHYISEGFNKAESISLTPFIRKISALTLSISSKGDSAALEVIKLLSYLMKYQDLAEKEGDTQAFQEVYNAREIAASWNYGYALRAHDSFLSSEDISKKSGIILDDKWSRLSAWSIIHFNDFNTYPFLYVKKAEVFYKTITDIEWLIENHGYDDRKDTPSVIIRALINDSKRIDIVEELIEKHLSANETNSLEIRESNGVDLNYISIYSYHFDCICEGYTTSLENLPALPDTSERYLFWEKYFSEIIEQLGILEGILIKKRIQEEETVKLLDRLGNILDLTKLHLAERAIWDRSYLIPETLFPFIFEKLSHLYISFFKASSNRLVAFIQENSNGQLGIYTEGYRESLSAVIQTFIKHNKTDDETHQLISLLEIHIIENVQNRWERTPELLKIIEYYSLSGDKELAEAAFREMLKTSMGPSWYKEAQLQLLNTTFRLDSDKNSTNDYALKFSSLLDYAAGEMTFQRYIRYDKESFIGELISKGNLDKAVEYLEFETIPPPTTLIQNAEYHKVDALALGSGNSQGARNITIQSGVLEILRNNMELTPQIRVALCSIFTVNDDVFRYVNSFAKEMAKAVSQINDSSQRALVFKLIVEIIASDDMEEDKARYVFGLKSNLMPEIHQELFAYAASSGIDVKLPADEDDESFSEDIREDSFSEFNDICSKDKGTTSIEELINLGIESFNKDRISIWYSNWSSSSTKARENLKALFDNPEQTITGLAPFIKDIGVEAWTVVDELLWFLDDKLNVDQIKQVYNDIANHFELLIRPEEYVFKKYDWIRNHEDRRSPNEQIVCFIIWLLNHPLGWIQVKAYKALEFLSAVIPNEVIRLLVDESVADKPILSCETSARILEDLSKRSPEEIQDVFSENPELVDSIIKVNHMTIFKSYLEIGKQLSSHGYNDLFNRVNNVLPDTIEGSSEVALDDEMLHHIEYEIEELNKMGILNREFCEGILETIQDHCEPLSWKDIEKSDKYLKRSYHEAKYYHGRYPEIVRYALNKTIVTRVGKNNIDQINNTINPA